MMGTVWKTLVCALPVVACCARAGSVVTQIEPQVLYAGKAIRFSYSERPYYVSGSAMVSVRTIAPAIGTTVRKSPDGRQWTLTTGADRLDFVVGSAYYTFNGARQLLRVAPEGRGPMVFVPYEMLQPISGGSLVIRAVLLPEQEPTVYYCDRQVRFRRSESPFREDGDVYVSLRTTASKIGAHVSQMRDGIRLTVMRGADKLTYEEGTHWYVFNGGLKPLRTASITRDNTVYVPIELLQVLVGQELRTR